MRFPELLGNEALKRRLSAAGTRLGHCYILEGPTGSGRRTLARNLAAAMECTAGGDRPCGSCAACRKVLRDEHPDVITVDSPTATVPIRLIRDMQADAYIRPNEGARKVYLIARAQDMQGPAQNALLKLLEEPPPYCVFLLRTDSAEKLLGTVRSRAVTLSLSPLSRETLQSALLQRRPDASPQQLARAMDRSEGFLGAALTLLDTPETELEQQSAALLEALASGDELRLYSALVPLEKRKRPELLSLLALFRQDLVRAMDPGTASPLDAPKLYHAAQTVAEAITLLQANASAGHAAGYLMANLYS